MKFCSSLSVQTKNSDKLIYNHAIFGFKFNKTIQILSFMGIFFLFFLQQGYAQIIPKTNWSLIYVDSEELVKENGAGTNAIDGASGTRWHTKWFGGADPLPHEIQIDLGAGYTVSGFRYLPNQLNGRIKDWEFYVSASTADWGTPVATGTFANSATEKEIVFTAKAGQYIRLRALSEVNGNQWTHIAEINVLGVVSGNQSPNGVIDKPSGNVTINVGDAVEFTGTGTDSDGNVPLTYLWNFGSGAGISDATAEDPGMLTFNNPGVFTVTFTVTDALGLADSTPATRTVTVQSGTSVIPHTNWSLIYVDSQELTGENGVGINAIDGASTTRWHTKWYGGADPLPHEIQVDLGGVYNVSGFRYLPNQLNGRIKDCEFYVSASTADWGTPVATGTFANSATEKEIVFTAKAGQYIRLRALSEVNGKQWTHIAELNVLGVLSSEVFVSIIAPNNYYLQVSSDLSVLADAYNLQQGWRILFVSDMGTPNEQSITDYIEPYEVIFTNLAKGEHVVDAFVVDDQGNKVIGTYTHDKKIQVGIGDYYVAIGDSITKMEGDDVTYDDASGDGRNLGGGYEPVLNDLLTVAKGYSHNISNEGVGGTTSADGLASVPTILTKHPNAQRYLVMYGTNDARPWLPIPSGKGLNPGNPGYPGTFKDNMQRIIDAIKNDIKEVCLAKPPIALGDSAFSNPPYEDPNNGARSLLIQEYNQVIDELVINPQNGIVITPPDFYNYFNDLDTITGRHHYEDEYSDNIHPNGIGYRSMADLWSQALTQ
ncbi:MAG: discoidin domain-containing protein [Candidatus Kuenenia stuttgartiensis]|nr:discoidin domain-containing protein [Candidatus Kuenenia stuttgartiensis]